jgi:predicted MFS family arabinose efflux permease
MVGALLVGPFGVRIPFLVCGAFALVALLALARRSLPRPPISEHPHRLGLDLLRLREMQVGVLLTMALFFPVGMYDAILDRYMTDRGASNVLIGIGFLLYGIPFALLATFGGRLADRHGAFRMSMISLILVVPLTAVYGVLTAPLVITAMFAFEGAAQALGVPASQTFVAQAAPVGRASAAQGLSGAMNLLGATASAFAGPAVYGAWGAGAAFGGAAVLVALAGITARLLHDGRTGVVAAPNPSP